MSFILLALSPRGIKDRISADVCVDRWLNVLSLVEDNANRGTEADFAHSLTYQEIDFIPRQIGHWIPQWSCGP